MDGDGGCRILLVVASSMYYRLAGFDPAIIINNQ